MFRVFRKLLGNERTKESFQHRFLHFETLEDRRLLAFTHPGLLSTLVDLDRMEAKVAALESPWIDSWNILVSNTSGMLSAVPEAVATIYVGTNSAGQAENYMRVARDAARSYQLALRYQVSGNTAFADKAVEIMNAWATINTSWDGDTNVSLRKGLYGYQFACAAELMRDYSGWQATDFAAFQNYMVDEYYSTNTYFLTYHHGTVDGHYWANWDLAAMSSMLAIGVLADRQDIFDEAINYFHSGVGNGAIDNAVYYVHPNGLAQWQESGRDQGHTLLGPQLMGTFMEIAWNQGYDLYSSNDNVFLASMEYISKYNTWHDVPYVAYVWRHAHTYDYAEDIQAVIGASGRGQIRPGWDLIYNHYVNRMGLAAPYTQEYAAMVGPEGGGFNYGSTSGGFDSLGFTTLTHSLDPIVSGAVPTSLRPYVEGRQITLSWAGSAYAESYNVKRSTTSGGPYTTLATVGPENLFYVDPGLTSGTTYYYVVSANNPGGESANSAEAAATASGQLHGVVIGTEGSFGSAGATRDLAFDGSLENYFDAPASSAWAGLDLGSGVSAAITGVRFAPRLGFAGRMVGGKFQGSNTADFSSGVVDLYTITTAPTDGVLTSQNFRASIPLRYVRYVGPAGSYCNVAELQFLGNVSGLTAPAAPTAPTATVDERVVTLSWTAVAGAESYNVKRASTSGGPYTLLENTANTSFSDQDLGVGTYYYTVSAVNSAGQSANSPESFATTTDLRARWMFNELAGTSAADATGGGSDGTLVSGPTWVVGKIENSVRLDGVDDYVTLPTGVVNGLTDYTIATWVYLGTNSNWSRIFDFGSSASVNMFLTPKNGSDGDLRFAITTGGGSGEQRIDTSATIPTNAWAHVAVTWTGNLGILYLNGTEVGRNSAMTLNPSSLGATTLNYLGKSQYADPYLNGRIDDFRIYNRALSPTEIGQLHYAPAVLGDYDLGGTVNGADFLAWQRQLGGEVPVYTQADGDGSGGVGAADLDVWSNHYPATPLVANLVALSVDLALAEDLAMPAVETAPVDLALAALATDPASQEDAVGWATAKRRPIEQMVVSNHKEHSGYASRGVGRSEVATQQITFLLGE